MSNSNIKWEQTLPSSQNEQTKDQKQKQICHGKKAEASSSHISYKAKRPHAEVAESSAEETEHIYH